MRRTLWLCLLIFPTARISAQTTLPPSQYFLNLKGTLKDTAGNILTGNHSVQFRLYDGNTATSNLLYTETQSIIPTITPATLPNLKDKGGRYAVKLGLATNNPLPKTLFYNGTATRTLWVEVRVDSNTPPLTDRQQLLQIPADSSTNQSMNQVIWVTNALDKIDKKKLREAAALAFYIRTIYTKQINGTTIYKDLDPNFVTLSLIKAEGTFNQRYRSVTTGDFKVSMLPIDAVTNLYGILVQQPGDPVTNEIISESLKFAAGTLKLTDSTNAYKQFSYELGRMASTASFNSYQTQQLEQLYLLARQNPNVAAVVDTFFGYGFNASVYDSASTILAKNTALRDSVNFAPLANQIEADGTMISTVNTALENIADFYDRMTLATVELNKGMAKVTAAQKSNYVGTTSVPNSGNDIKGFIATAFANTQGKLDSAPACTYATQVQMLDTSAYNKYQIAVDSLNIAAGVAATAADTIRAVGDVATFPPNPVAATADGISAVGNGLTTAASALTLAADLGAFGPSQQDAIQDGITQLSAQLSSVQQQLDQRLQFMDSRIVALYDQLGKDFAALSAALQQGFDKVTAAISVLQTDLISVQYKLDRLTQSFSDFETLSVRNTLVGDLAQINNWGTIVPLPGAPGSSTDFNGPFGRTQAYATSTVLTQLENGNKGQNGFASTYGDADIAGNLDSDATKNLSYILGFIGNRFYNHTSDGYTSPNVNPLTGSQVANPIGWEMSSLGVMRAVTLDYDYYGKPAIQSPTSVFQTAYNVGQGVQDAANSIVLQKKINPITGNPVYASNGVQIIEKSPVMGDMMLHQSKLATTLYNAIVTEEATFIAAYPGIHGAGTTPTATEIIQDVVAQINTHGTAVSNAADNLDGSRRMMEQMFELGLSRSVKTNDQLSSLLYSSGISNFTDTSGTAAADPNAQRLPDGGLVRALYHNWVTSIPTALTTAPTVTVSSASTSTLPAGNYYVVVSYLTNPAAGAASESLLSPETAITISANSSAQKMVISSPTGLPAPQKYRVYIGKTSGGPYYLQYPSTTNGTVPSTPMGTAFTVSTAIYSDASIPPALQYNQYVTGDPKAIFQTAQSGRLTSLSNLLLGANYTDTTQNPPVTSYVSGLLDNLASDANITQTGNPLGEQIANVDAILSRLAFLLIPSVNGTISSTKSLANTIMTFTFRGTGANNFMAPVVLDSTGSYTVNVPRDLYTMLAKEDGFLQSKVQVANAGQLIDTRSGTVQSANAALIVGDLNGDNIINNTDLILLRNALNSYKLQPGWDAKYDFNGDGVVDASDLALLTANLGSNQYLYDLNGDFKIDANDVALLKAVINDPLRNRRTSANWNPLADLNGDGKVDNTDLRLLVPKLGKRGDS